MHRVGQGFAQTQRYEQEVEILREEDECKNRNEEEYRWEYSNGDPQAICLDESWEEIEGEEKGEDIDSLTVPTHELNICDSFVGAVLLLVSVIVGFII